MAPAALAETQNPLCTQCHRVIVENDADTCATIPPWKRGTAADTCATASPITEE